MTAREVRAFTATPEQVAAATSLVTRWLMGARHAGAEGERYAERFEAAQELLGHFGLTVTRDGRGAVIIAQAHDNG